MALNLAGVKLILGLIEKYKIDFSEIYKIAVDVGIGEEIQIQNLEKNLRRGRRRKL